MSRRNNGRNTIKNVDPAIFLRQKSGDGFFNFALLNAAGANPNALVATVGLLNFNLLKVGLLSFDGNVVSVGNLMSFQITFAANATSLRHCALHINSFCWRDLSLTQSRDSIRNTS